MQLRPRMSMRDGLVLTFVTVLVLVPLTKGVVADQNEVNNRIRCARNLHQIGQAMLLYANENRGKYPRTIYQRDEKPVWGTPYEAHPDTPVTRDANPFDATGKTAPAANDVTASLFLVLRTQDITTDVFRCPSANLPPLDFGRDEHGQRRTPQYYTNWPGKASLAQHLSYSYANPFPSTDAIASGYKLDNTVPPDFAVMADMNPGGPDLTKLTPDTPADTLRLAGNSLNHNRDGQNVLFGDGHITFVTTPFSGVQHDNIFTAKGPELAARRNANAEVVASPAEANDSILLPTAADLGQTVHPADGTETAAPAPTTAPAR